MDITKDLDQAREQYHKAMAVAADHVLELLAQHQLLELVRWKLDGGAPAAVMVPVVTPTKWLKESPAAPKPAARRAKTDGGGQKTCTRPGCSKRHAAQGLCSMHYYRQTHGVEMDGPSARGRPRARASNPAASSSPEPAEEPTKPTAAPTGKLDNPKVVTRAMLVRGTVPTMRNDCKALNRCALIMRRRGARRWTCSSCSGTSLGK